MRLFLGIPVSPELREHLQQAWSRVEAPPKKLRAVPPENWHVTLAFLDEIADDKIEPLAELLAKGTEKSPKGAFLVGKFETFPHKKPTRLVARAMTAYTEDWKKFVENLRDFASIMAPNVDRKPWLPHISLGRSEKNLILPNWSAQFVDFAWIPEEFCLYNSIHTAEGSKYETLYSFPIEL